MRRIVLVGPPLAGKLTLLRRIAAARGSRVEGFDISDGQSPPDLGSRTRFMLGGTIHEVVTIAGCPLSKQAWRTQLADVDAAALVLDPQSARLEANREAVSLAQASDGAPELGCVVVTKQDLVQRGVESIASERLLDGTRFHDWPVFLTRLDRPATLLQPIEWLLAQLSDRT